MTRHPARLGSLSLRTATRAALGVVGSVMALGAFAAPAIAAPPNGSANYTFIPVRNTADLTFNQELGINNTGLVAGYYGSGEAGHPNKGYLVTPPYRSTNFTSENYPGSVQTQVTGLNNFGTTVGFWVNSGGGNFGFYDINGIYKTVNYPTGANASPQVDQLLGVNDNNVAVGFYTDNTGTNHGFTYNINTGTFSLVTVSGLTNITATAINNLGDIAGFGTNSGGVTVGFLKLSNGTVDTLPFPGATATQAFGVNSGEEVVGAYSVGSSNHGFAWTPGFGFQTVNDSGGPNATLLNGVNDRGQLVGFYTNSGGLTIGLVATPKG